MSGDIVSVKIEGMENLRALVKQLEKAVGPAATEPYLMKAAQIMTKNVRANVQAMFPASNSRKKKTEHFLRDAPATRMGTMYSWAQPRSAISFMRYRGSKGAPHAHLVEYGARGGQMPARPYWRPAYDASRDAIFALVKAAVIANIRKAAR